MLSLQNKSQFSKGFLGFKAHSASHRLLDEEGLLMRYDHKNPILAVYYRPRGDWDAAQMKADFSEFKASGLRSVWLFYDPFYDVQAPEKIAILLDHCAAIGLTLAPALGQFLQLEAHPEVKIINADGTSS